MDSASQFNFKNILAVGAHPDDIEFGCFGFLYKQRKLGSEISAFIATLGSKGDPTSGTTRKIESTSALELLRPKHLQFREQAGMGAADFDEVLELLFNCIQFIKPDLILTLSPHDTHQEHRLLHDVTLAAARRSAASIMNYSILSNTLQFTPSVFVDVQNEFPLKREALQFHKSQAGKYYLSNEYLEISHSHNYASLHGIRYCETFEVVRLLIA